MLKLGQKSRDPSYSSYHSFATSSIDSLLGSAEQATTLCFLQVMSHLVGKPAPAITGVKDQNGNDFDSAGIFGHVPVVLFFYPQAMTMGC